MVVDDKTGHILAASKATDKFQVASLTKIATAIVVLDWARVGNHGLEQTMTIPASALASGAANPIGFMAGDQLTLRDLLYAALLQSDNIAAAALAHNVGIALPASAEDNSAKGESTPDTRFVTQMNALARHLGMTRTRFFNPAGADSDGVRPYPNKLRPYSTAADLARLTRLALTKADFRFFVAQKERKITITRAGAAAPAPTAPALDPALAAPDPAAGPAVPAAPASVSSTYLLRNTNELLGVHNVDGVKTGQTQLAGSCLIISAARESIVKVLEGGKSEITPRRLIVVVLGSQDRFGEGARLLERGEGLYDQWAAQGRQMDPKVDLDSAGR